MTNLLGDINIANIFYKSTSILKDWQTQEPEILDPGAIEVPNASIGVLQILRTWADMHVHSSSLRQPPAAEVSHPFKDQMECILLCVPRDQSHIS
jgi:hypothetical protein